MFKRLLNCSIPTNLDVGRRVLSMLRADPRLTAAASVLGVGFGELEAAWQTLTEVNTAVMDAGNLRNENGRKFAEALREFGMVSLCAGGNRPGVQPYVIYFPEGYGDVRKLKAPELIQFAGQVITLLEKETAPKLVRYRELIAVSCAEFVTVQENYETAVRNQADAKAYGRAARSRFVHALEEARNLAAASFVDVPDHVKDIFRPAAGPRYRPAEEPEEVVTPGDPEVVPDPEIAPPPADSGERAA